MQRLTAYLVPDVLPVPVQTRYRQPPRLPSMSIPRANSQREGAFESRPADSKAHRSQGAHLYPRSLREEGRGSWWPRASHYLTSEAVTWEGGWRCWVGGLAV